MDLRPKKAWVFALVAWLVPMTGQAGHDGQNGAPHTALTFGVVPQASATRLAEIWLPVIEALAARTGLDIRFRTDPNIAAFTEQLTHGAYDIAYMNPQHYSTFMKSGYTGLVTDVAHPLVGLLLAHRERALDDLAALAGREVCFPAPQAFAATRIPLQALAAAGVEVRARYVGSHDSVYRLVAAGLCDAGGGIHRTLASTPPEVRQSLKVIWQSAPYPNHVIAVRTARVQANVRAQLRQTLLEMEHDPAARRRLSEAGLTGLGPVEDRHYLILQPRRTP